MDMLRAWLDGYIIGGGFNGGFVSAKLMWDNIPMYLKLAVTYPEFVQKWDAVSEGMRKFKELVKPDALRKIRDVLHEGSTGVR